MKLIKVHELLFSDGKVKTIPYHINPYQIVHIHPDDGLHQNGYLGSQAYVCLIGKYLYTKESPEEIASLISQQQ